MEILERPQNIECIKRYGVSVPSLGVSEKVIMKSTYHICKKLQIVSSYSSIQIVQDGLLSNITTYYDFSRGWFGIKQTQTPFSRIPIDLKMDVTINGEAAS